MPCMNLKVPTLTYGDVCYYDIVKSQHEINPSG